jgi:hypothetical protein
MREAMPSIGLAKGDRLIPTTTLLDVASFDTATLPVTVRFFVYNKDSRLTNVTPLYEIPNLTADRICVDLLHSWHLGGVSEFVGEVLWFVVHSGVYTKHARITSATDAHKVSLIRLKADLWAYYQRRTERDPDFKTTGSRVASSFQRCQRVRGLEIRSPILRKPNGSRVQSHGRPIVSFNLCCIWFDILRHTLPPGRHCWNGFATRSGI